MRGLALARGSVGVGSGRGEEEHVWRGERCFWPLSLFHRAGPAPLSPFQREGAPIQGRPAHSPHTHTTMPPRSRSKSKVSAWEGGEEGAHTAPHNALARLTAAPSPSHPLTAPPGRPDRGGGGAAKAGGRHAGPHPQPGGEVEREGKREGRRREERSALDLGPSHPLPSPPSKTLTHFSLLSHLHSSRRPSSSRSWTACCRRRRWRRARRRREGSAGGRAGGGSEDEGGHVRACALFFFFMFRFSGHGQGSSSISRQTRHKDKHFDNRRGGTKAAGCGLRLCARGV